VRRLVFIVDLMNVFSVLRGKMTVLLWRYWYSEIVRRTVNVSNVPVMDEVNGVDVTQMRQKLCSVHVKSGGSKGILWPLTWKSGGQLIPWPRASAVYGFRLCF